MPSSLSLFAVPGLPMIEPGMDLAGEIIVGLQRAGSELRDGDLLAVAQKVVSKAEGRTVALREVEPSAAAVELARSAGKDPRVVQLILDESTRIVRHRPGVIIAEHRLGIVLANAGIDRSNVGAADDVVLLLPEDPDRSARALRGALEERLALRLGVVITDSIGRPWRLGTTGTAIGCAGVPALEDLRGAADLYGRSLEVSEVATADAAAAAAGLLMGEAGEACPVVVLRGLDAGRSGQRARDVLRPAHENLFA